MEVSIIKTVVTHTITTDAEKNSEYGDAYINVREEPDNSIRIQIGCDTLGTTDELLLSRKSAMDLRALLGLIK